MATKTGKNRGRPSVYSENVARAICDRIAAGESLRAVCRESAMPDRGTVRDWLDAHPDFSRHYARAREDRADDVFDDIERIECAVEAGELNPNSARVIIDSRKWRLARMSRRYSDRHTVEVTNNAGIKTYAVLEASPDIWPVPLNRTDAVRR